MEGDYKIVDFTWCHTCKYRKLLEHEQPCRECLSSPARVDSHKPERWEEVKK